jgi:hypothetical protein
MITMERLLAILVKKGVIDLLEVRNGDNDLKSFQDAIRTIRTSITIERCTRDCVMAIT